MADNDDALAATALALNEDAKAARRRKGATRTPDDGGKDGDVAGALSDLGDAVNAQAGAGTNGLDLSEKAHTTAIDRMETMASETILAADSMVSDVRDFLLDQIKSRPKPWSGTSEAEQRDVIAACEHAGRELVRKIVETIAAQGAPQSVRALMGKATLGDDIAVTLKIKPVAIEETDAAVLFIHRAHGKHVMITMATTEDYSNSQRDAQFDPDQTDMQFEAGPVDDGRPHGGQGPEGDTDLADGA